ncbi:MAG: nucleoside recognition domain-containing protein [Flavobacteriales bacterium]
MALNVVFIGFFLVAFVIALIRFFMGEHDVFNNIVTSIFDNSKTGYEISIGLAAALTLWMGIMKVGENGGAVKIITCLFSPFFRKLFPEIPKDHPASGSIMMNFSANMLGLDNAATPMGIKAMKELQELNPDKEKASRSQLMFTVINAGGMTLIPVSILAVRASILNEQASLHPGAIVDASATSVFIPILIATFFSCISSIIIVSLIQKINLFDKVILSYLMGGIIVVSLFTMYMMKLDKKVMEEQSKILASIFIFSIIVFFVILGLKNKSNVYESFIEGAKGGFMTAVGIIPYLIGLLVAIGVFRTCGALDFITDGIKEVVLFFNGDTGFVEAMPTALMKPLSGGGARGLMVETMKNNTFIVAENGHLRESFSSYVVSTIQGGTETTFYTLAVYYGAVGIKNTRYALGAGLVVDLIGTIVAIIAAYIFYS